MTRQNKRILFFLQILAIFIVTISCHHEKGGDKPVKPSYNYNLAPTDKILQFDIGSNIVNHSLCLMSFVGADSTQYLYYLSAYSNNLCVFNIDEMQLEKTIQFKQKGPDGVGDVWGFEISSPDSIWVTSMFGRHLCLMDSKAKLLRKYDCSKYKQEEPIGYLATRTRENMRLGFKGSKIYLSYYPGVTKNNAQSLLPKDVRFVAEIDTINKTLQTVNIGFPEDFWDRADYPAFPGFFEAKNCFYVNYMYSDNIAVSTDGENWETRRVPSKYAKLGKLYPMEQAQGVSTHYSRLVYDPFRDVFYRFVVQGHPLIEGREFLDCLRHPQNVSIIILDGKLNIIGETKFPPDIYDESGFFILKDGLYLSRSHPYNPEYNIDKLTFQQLILVKNEK